MNVAITEQSGVQVLKLTGRVDALSANQLQTTVDSVLEGGALRLVFDLQDVPFISSAGLRVVLSAAKRVYQKGKVAVCNLSSSVQQVFEMVGFGNIVSVCPDLASAVETAAK